MNFKFFPVVQNNEKLSCIIDKFKIETGQNKGKYIITICFLNKNQLTIAINKYIKNNDDLDDFQVFKWSINNWYEVVKIKKKWVMKKKKCNKTTECNINFPYLKDFKSWLKIVLNIDESIIQNLNENFEEELKNEFYEEQYMLFEKTKAETEEYIVSRIQMPTIKRGLECLL